MVALRSVIFSFLFILFWTLSKSQTKADTIKTLTNYSIKYLNMLFNKKDINNAVKYWSGNVYDELKAGYNNGKIAYNSNSDVTQLFLKDISFLFKENKGRIKFQMQDSASMFIDDDGYKFFLISFKMKTKIKLDSTLIDISLDFVSKDKGVTWKVNTDHWIKRFMFFLYRKRVY